MQRRRPAVMAVAAVAMAAALGAPAVAEAQIDSTAAWGSHLSNTYRVAPNVTYHTTNNYANKVDLYLPHAEGPTPVLIYIHGGGWRSGSKERFVLRLLPWLEKGWAVVNVQYRLAQVALAPAAVEDCLCALRWVIRNAEEHDIDASRIVVTGHSAGGHLALTTGMVPASAGLDRECPGPEALSVAAVINWYGITDVGDLLDGPNKKNYAVQWLGSMPDRFEVAERVSPLTWVRPGLPPVLTIHGDADGVVPYEHATRLHAKLEAAGVANQLHTVSGGGHGFDREETVAAFEIIQAFLATHGLTAGGAEKITGGGQ